MDVWVNNAGAGLSKSIEAFTDEEMDKLIDTNFKSAYWGCAAASAHMKGHGGVILNVTSFGAKMPRVFGGMYSATKIAVESITKSFAAELAPYGIRVVSILPGLIETPMTEGRVALNRDELTRCISSHQLGRPEHIAKPMVFLASEAAEYITGVSVEISGGKYSVQDPWKAWESVENV